ncbi:peptidase M1 [Modestobacter sp. URMC 112]
MAGRARRAGAAVLALLVVAALAVALVLHDRRQLTSGPAPVPGPAPPPAQAGGCPDERAAPDPDRPVVDLDFSLSDDRRTVTGTERVVFTPDLPVDELVFRLVPNAPDTAARGNRLTVDAVRGPGLGAGGYEAAGADEPGGLYVVPLTAVLAAGGSVELELDFTLRLGEAAFDRVGAAEDVSWWASGAPLLAWEPGVGWARDPFVEVLGETSSSPAADTTVTVEAPAALTVLMTGEQQPPTAPVDGRRTWTAVEPVARDVSVAVGEFTTAETDVAGVRVTTGVLAGEDEGDARRQAEELAAETVAAIEALSARFGPFPYRTLTVPSLGDYGGGVEYPSSILLASGDDGVLVHEVGHMWFYGMVGNSQYRDPWLDEAFASYTESVTEERDPARTAAVLDRPGDVGASMGAFADDRGYVSTVYGKGGAMLLTAREAAGAEQFDAALRCYANAQAWRTATPRDVAGALADLPAALDVLVRAGALDPGDLPG